MSFILKNPLLGVLNEDIKLNLNVNDDLTICIRPMVEADAQKLFFVINTNITHLNRWVFYGFPSITEEVTKKMVDNACVCWQEHYEYNFIIEDAYTQKILGFAIINEISQNFCTCNIGYWLIKKATGKGIIHVALAYLAKLALETIKVARAEVVIEVENMASIASIRKCPFSLHYEGILKSRVNFHGLNSDAHMFALTKENLPEINQFLRKHYILNDV
jgi:ribosomal-protein-serine acetyltransferase